MPAYNCANTIKQSVMSIFDGNFEKGDEVIVVNDGSTDNTREIILKLQKKYPDIHLIDNPKNLGCPASRNVGIGKSKNELIFNLDADNILAPNSIQRLKKYLIDEKADVAAFGGLYYFQYSTKVLSHKWIFNPGIFTLADFFSGPYTPSHCGNYLYTKKAWLKVGKYWENGPGLHESWFFTFKQLINGSKFVILSDSFYYHRIGYDSLTIRETRNNHRNSLLATEMILPQINLLEDADAAYVQSKEGSETWFDNIKEHPLKLKGQPLGKYGYVVYYKQTLLRRVASKILHTIYA